MKYSPCMWNTQDLIHIFKCEKLSNKTGAHPEEICGTCTTGDCSEKNIALTQKSPQQIHKHDFCPIIAKSTTNLHHFNELQNKTGLQFHFPQD